MLKSFASFGFCKAHAAAFALPTFHSAWLKTHHPAAFLAGILTHDPGMYPKRLLLDDARSFGIPVLGLDVNASRDTYRIERVDAPDAERTDLAGRPARRDPDPATPTPPTRMPGCPAWRRTRQPYGIRLSLADVKGISGAEVARIVAGQPYADLGDFWTRARVSRPVTERLVLAGAFDALHGMGGGGLGRRGRVTRRDLLLHVAELERWERGGGAAPRSSRRLVIPSIAPPREVAGERVDVRERAAAQSQAAREVVPAAEQPTQLTLDLGDRPQLGAGAGLPEMTGPERVRAELDVLGLDVSAHVVEFYAPLLRALGVTRSRDLLGARSRSEVWVAGVKVATQTPPVRSGRRVVFLTLDDSTGPSDCTFFEDVQGPYAGVVFHSWLLLVRGVLRRTGDRGVSIRATGAWELAALWDAWQLGGLDARARRDRRRGGGCRGPRRGGRGRRPRERRPHRAPGARARLGVQAVARTPTSSPPGADPRSGRGASPARGARGPGRRAALAQAVARQPRQLRTLGWSRRSPPAAATRTPKESRRVRRAWPTPPRGRPARAAHGGRPGGARHPRGRAAAPTSAARCGCSTSAAAPAAPPCPLAAAGHDVTVVDPSPDALASLARRAAETGTSERIHPVQGDTDTVGETGADGRRPAYDLVCLHGTLEVVDDPDAALANIAAVLARGGTLSLVVAQRLARRPGPGPRRAVRPGPGDPRAPRRALGRRRPRAPAVRRAGGARPAHRPRPHHRRRATACASSATSCPRPWSTPRPTGPPCSTLEDVASHHPDHPLLGELGSVRHVLATRD